MLLFKRCIFAFLCNIADTVVDIEERKKKPKPDPEPDTEEPEYLTGDIDPEEDLYEAEESGPATFAPAYSDTEPEESEDRLVSQEMFEFRSKCLSLSEKWDATCQNQAFPTKIGECCQLSFDIMFVGQGHTNSKLCISINACSSILQIT